MWDSSDRVSAWDGEEMRCEGENVDVRSSKQTVPESVRTW